MPSNVWAHLRTQLFASLCRHVFFVACPWPRGAAQAFGYLINSTPYCFMDFLELAGGRRASAAMPLCCSVFFLVLVSQPDPIFIESAHVSFAYLSLMRRILWLWALARLSCSRQSKETRLDLFLRALQKCKVPHQVECLVLGVQGLGCRV